MPGLFTTTSLKTMFPDIPIWIFSIYFQNFLSQTLTGIINVRAVHKYKHQIKIAVHSRFIGISKKWQLCNSRINNTERVFCHTAVEYLIIQIRIGARN